MKYKETGFRAIFHTFFLIELNESIKSMIKVLAYGIQSHASASKHNPFASIR